MHTNLVALTPNIFVQTEYGLDPLIEERSTPLERSAGLERKQTYFFSGFSSFGLAASVGSFLSIFMKRIQSPSAGVGN